MSTLPKPRRLPREVSTDAHFARGAVYMNRVLKQVHTAEVAAAYDAGFDSGVQSEKLAQSLADKFSPARAMAAAIRAAREEDGK